MTLVVQDATILIDLALCDCAEAWFSTGIETWTTGWIFPLEISDPIQRRIYADYVASGALKVFHPKEAALGEIEMLKGRLSQGLSRADVSALHLAQTFGARATLATGDRALRKAAERERVPVCGVLRLFDLMVAGGKDKGRGLPARVAARKLHYLLSHPQCHLPKAPCEERIKKWTSGRAI